MASLLPYRLGIAWLRDSFRPLKLAPFPFVGVVVFSLLMTGLLSSIPLLGTALAGIWMPFASVLTGLAARDALEGKTPGYYPLPVLFRNAKIRRTLFIIGLGAAVWVELDTLLFQMLAQDDISRWVVKDGSIDMDSVAAHFPAAALVTSFVLYLPLLMLTLFAPLLAALKRQSAAKSLFYSFFGTLRAVIPALLWLLCTGGIVSAVFLTAESISLAAGSLAFFTFAAPLLVAFASAVCQAGIWVMYRDIFADTREDAPVLPELTSRRRPVR